MRRSPARNHAHAAGRAAVWIALPLALASLAGCGAVFRHGAPATLAAPPARHAETVASLVEQAALAPREPYWPYRQACAYVASDSLASAEAALGQALARDPGYAPALSLLSKLYFESHRNDQAIRLLEAARTNSAVFPTGLPPALLADLALHYQAIGRPDRAQALVAGLAGRDLREVDAAVVYLNLSGTAADSAAALAAHARDRQPKSAPRQNNYGIARLRAGDPEGARKAFLAAVSLDPSLPGPYYNLAILEKFYALDEVAAERWFKLYRERASDDPDGLAQALGKGEPRPLAEERDPR